MFFPSVSEVKNLATQGYNFIPVAIECSGDMETPISVYKKLEKNKYCFLLESVEGGQKIARYSFIGRNPFLLFESRNNISKITENRVVIEKTGNPVHILEEICNRYKSPDISSIPRFSGGGTGFFSYDLVRSFENLPNPPKDDTNIPDSHFIFTDEVIAFDHLRHKIVLMVNMQINEGTDIDLAYSKAIRRIMDIQSELKAKVPQGTSKIKALTGKTTELKSNLSKEQYIEIVEKAKDYIKNGDIFQVVLAQRFTCDVDVEAFNVYRALRSINPSPYMYYLNFGDYEVVGASPEMLLRVENGIMQTCPIAGTRKRGATNEEDERLADELLADPKELAEHNMLVDLGRNDIGRVAEFGSVKVTDYKYIQRFSHVMHIVSNVEGRLKSGKTVFDALASVLPAGTLSGAPKIRAMEIIDELETVKRSVYGGAVCYVSFNGNFDSCITIRTAMIKNGKAYIGAGAGIVYDSVPEKEYEECINKAGAMFSALKEAGEMA